MKNAYVHLVPQWNLQIFHSFVFHSFSKGGRGKVNDTNFTLCTVFFYVFPKEFCSSDFFCWLIINPFFDKIPNSNLIYWELTISLKGQNNAISSSDNSIFCWTKETYYTISIAIDRISKPKIIYWKVPKSLTRPLSEDKTANLGRVDHSCPNKAGDSVYL